MANRSDNFNRSDSSSSLGSPSDGGAAWSALAGTWGVSSNRAYCVSGNPAQAVLDAGSADVDVQATVAVVGSNPGIVFRASDASNHLIWYTSASSQAVYKKVAGGSYTLVSGSSTSFTCSAGDVLKVSLAGSSIKCYQNGTLKVSVTDSFNSTATKHGLFSQASDATTRYDDFSATIASSFVADRSNVLNGSGTVTLTLTGTNTAWTGSPFSLTANPTGWSISSQSVASGTSATVTLTKGSGTGTITISDGTTTANVTATITGTAVATGNSSTAATWDTLERPGSGHKVVIPTGYTVTGDTTWTFGTSPSDTTTNVLTCTGTGSLTVADGITVTVRGNASIDNGVLQVGTGSTGGAVLEFDASNATTTTTTYKCVIGGNGKTSSRFKMRGTSGSYAVVRSNAGGGNAQTSVTDGLYDCQYGSFVRIGDSSNDGQAISILAATTGTHTFSYCSVDSGSGRLNTASTLPVGMGLSLSRFISAATTGCRLSGNTPSGGVTRTVNLCSFAGPFTFSEVNFTVTNTVFDNDGGGLSNTGVWASGQFDGNFVRLTNTSGSGLIGIGLRGDVTGLYVLADGGTDNPHILLPRDTGAAQTIDGAVVEYTKGIVTDGGNWFYGAGTWTLIRCIQLPTVNAGSTGAVGAITPTSGCSWKVIHCTLHSVHYNGGILIGDSSVAAAELTEVRDNIFWVPSGVSGTSVSAIGSAVSAVTDIMTPSGCHHNAHINIGTPKYEGTYTLGTPGANDVSITAASLPFLDVNRNIATWAVTQGSSASTYEDRILDARSYLRADPSLVADLLTYVRGGQAPTDLSLVGAASDGGTIGAFDVPFVNVAFSATAGNHSLSSSLTSTPPPSRTLTFAATTGADSLASSVTAVAPPSRTLAFAATATADSLASLVTTSAPPSRTLTFAATSAADSLSASFTSVASTARTFAFAGSAGSDSIASSLASVSPASRTLAFAATGAGDSLASSLTTVAPGARAFTFAATAGSDSLASSLTPTTPPGRTMAFAVTAGAHSLASSLATLGAGVRTMTFAAAAGSDSLSVSLATGGGGPPPPLPPDLLSAVVAYLKATPAVTDLVPAGSIYKLKAPAGASAPYIVVPEYEENLPGDSADDRTYDLTVTVVTTSLGPGVDDDTQARQIALVLRNALENANTNPGAVSRAPLAWQGGTETAFLPGDNGPRRLAGIGKGGNYVYVDEIPYQVWATPEF